MKQLQIAIIGGGLSGTLTAIHLLRAAREATTVYLVEKDDQKLHRGVAYSSRLPYQPLNVPAYRMSLFQELPHDFLEWLQENQHLYPGQLAVPVSAYDFISRRIFGDYVVQRLQEATAHAQPGVQLVHLKTEVLSLEQGPLAGEYTLELKNHPPLQAQKVVLALGNLAPAPLPIPNADFYKSPRYHATPWSAAVVESLPPDDSLLLIGSSLTMVDLVGSLAARGHRGAIYVVSRHGLVPKAYQVGAKPYSLSRLPPVGHLSPGQALRYVREEVALAQQEGITWHSVLDALREHLPDIWQNFTLPEKKQFLRHLRPYWEVHRHRMPLASHQLLENLHQKGQLKIIAGAVKDMEEINEKASVTLQPRKSASPHTLQIDQVVNCTGPLCDYTKSQEPLLRQLLQQGHIAPDSLRLGLMATPAGEVLNAAGHPTENLYSLGPPLKGMLYESSALREIRQQAASLAGLLLFGETMLAAAL